MRPLTACLIVTALIAVMAYCAPAPASEPEPDVMSYYGTTPEGWRVMSYCVDGYKYLHLERAGSALALGGIPMIQDAMGPGVSLPKCSGGKPKPRPQP